MLLPSLYRQSAVKTAVIAILLLWIVSCDNRKEIRETEPEISLGVWVTVFSKEKVLYSEPAALKLVEFCKKNGINEIYLQIMRSGKAYYDSETLGRDEYEKMTKKFGADPVDFLISQAKANNIKIFAWINVLSLAQNKEAPILAKYGASVLTRDKNLRASIRTQDVDDSDRFYLRDDQLFLEPGDERVVEHTLKVVEEITLRYPGFSGIHLDYIRYPYPVPSIPDSRFIDYGISYGFGERNLERFKSATGLNPRKDNVYRNNLHLQWDRWKRDQVTDLIHNISVLIRNRVAQWKISCAVVPTQERAYLVAYQDWPLWLDRGLVDYVVIMNYTKDERLLEETSKAAITCREKKKIFIGLGAFLSEKETKSLERSYRIVKQLNPAGIVFFSYDDFSGPGTAEFLASSQAK